MADSSFNKLQIHAEEWIEVPIQTWTHVTQRGEIWSLNYLCV